MKTLRHTIRNSVENLIWTSVWKPVWFSVSRNLIVGLYPISDDVLSSEIDPDIIRSSIYISIKKLNENYL
jgi:hypothetical protein